MHKKNIIDPQDISVVVQGAIDKNLTPQCLKSVRKHLPGAEIILSTWEGSDLSGLDYDILVINKDPGAYFFNPGKKNNNNRMILSTKKGLDKATKPYILKLRSDMFVVNDNICNITDNLLRVQDFRLFEKRIIVNDTYSLKFEEGPNGERHYRPFHISDWLFFGTSKDIKTLFDIPLAKEPENSQYFKKHKMPTDKYHRFPEALWRMSPEQYVCYTCAKKHFPKIIYKHILDYNDINIQQSEKFIVNNFYILSSYEIGIKNNKPPYDKLKITKDKNCKNGYYSHKIYLSDYKKYCDPNFLIPLKYTYKDVLKIRNDSAHFCTHIKNVYLPVRLILRYVDNILACVFYGMKIVLKSIFHSMRWCVKMVRAKVFVKFSPPRMTMRFFVNIILAKRSVSFVDLFYICLPHQRLTAIGSR